MDNATIQRYQQGGDIYNKLASQYGASGANAVAAAAATGSEQNVNAALTQLNYGQPLNTSTWDLLAGQLENDPLGAPLQSLNNQISALVGNIFSNKWVLLIIGLLIFFFVFDGLAVTRNVFKKK